MRKILLTIILCSSLDAVAFPENLRPDTLNQGNYKQINECPLNYCKNNDDGYSMRKWCEAHNGKWGQWPIVVGWTKVSGFDCFCGCNNLW